MLLRISTLAPSEMGNKAAEHARFGSNETPQTVNSLSIVGAQPPRTLDVVRRENGLERELEGGLGFGRRSGGERVG